MARKRMISPTIWEDPSFNKLSHTARLIFIGMFSNADDEGYLRSDVGVIKRLIFGFDDISMEKVDEHLSELTKMRSLHFYEVNDEKYTHFVHWNEHQKQQKDRISPSIFPKCIFCKNPAIVEVLKNVKGEENLPFRVKITQRDKMCMYCGLKFPNPPNSFIIEHIIPKKRGGKTDEENCVLACQTCNTKKGSRTPEEANMKIIDTTCIQNVSNLDKEVVEVGKVVEVEEVANSLKELNTGKDKLQAKWRV